jgi:hypothetical protein
VRAQRCRDQSAIGVQFTRLAPGHTQTLVQLRRIENRTHPRRHTLIAYKLAGEGAQARVRNRRLDLKGPNVAHRSTVTVAVLGAWETALVSGPTRRRAGAGLRWVASIDGWAAQQSCLCQRLSAIVLQRPESGVHPQQIAGRVASDRAADSGDQVVAL